MAAIFLGDFFIFFLVSLGVAQSIGKNFYRGRHVCAQRHQVTYQAPITQSYRRPIYREDLKRTVYQTAYRTIIRVRFGDKLVPGCCPGWTKRSVRDTSCMEAVCDNTCVNGRCIRPNICLCDRGYTGYRCDADINECSGRRHKCQQTCINTNGSYECACQDGFQLANDSTSCVFCLSCTQEFQDMQLQLQGMSSRIQELEVDKNSLQSNLTSALNQYEEAIQALHVVPPSSTSDATTTSHPEMPLLPLDRLASLSEQISILEEKMASCMCGSEYLLG